jgi:hypothetical protein
LKEHVQGRLAELVFNLDEVGISDWDDRETRKAAVPMTMDGQKINHAISRNVTDTSAIVRMSAAGKVLMPYIVTS